MSIALTDVLTFGKYKGQVVSDIFTADPSYLCWLRETKRVSNGDRTFLNVALVKLIDDHIASDKKLKAKYVLFRDLPVGTAAPNVAIATVIPRQVKAPEPESALAYAAEWGAF